MKKLLLIVLIFIGISNLKAQCPLTEAVDFTVTDIEGNEINLFSILDNGQYVVIDFFYTTCGPCQITAPKVNEAYLAFGCNNHDVFFMSMDIGDSNAECEEFDETYGVEYPTVSGQEGGGTAICNTYGIGAYPTVILIAPDHSIVEQDIWPIANGAYLISVIEGHGPTQNSCDTPVIEANFESSETSICVFHTIDFTSTSIGEIETYEWIFEGGSPATSTEQNPTVEYLEAGDFDVSLSVTGAGMTDTKTMEDYIHVEVCSGVTDLAGNSINIYPNPANDVVYIESDYAKSYSILNSLGEVVVSNLMQRGSNKVNVSGFEAATYIIKIQTEEGSIIKKLQIK
jgi:PKD repeat protein